MYYGIEHKTNSTIKLCGANQRLSRIYKFVLKKTRNRWLAKGNLNQNLAGSRCAIKRIYIERHLRSDISVYWAL